jgi:hypothetical protein
MTGKKREKKQIEQGKVQRWYHVLRWGDGLLYAVIGSLALILFLVFPAHNLNVNRRAVLTKDDTVILVLSEEQLQEGGVREIDANGYHYQLVYEAGRIRFAQADCPDQICVRTGWISRPGQLAACVPGRLILKIEGQSDEDPNAVDVIVR